MKEIDSDSHLKIILKQMCKSVGVKYSNIDFYSDKKPYYEQYSWSSIKENNFREWLVNYLLDNSMARLELMKFPVKSKKMCSEVANQFVAWYGWKTKKGKNEKVN